MNVLTKDQVSALIYFRTEDLLILYEAMLCAREHLCVKKGYNNAFYEKYRKFSAFIEAFKPILEEKPEYDDIERAKYSYQQSMFTLDALKTEEGKNVKSSKTNK